MKGHDDYIVNLMYQFGKFIRKIEGYGSDGKCVMSDRRVDENCIEVKYSPFGRSQYWIIKLEQHNE